MHYATAVNCMDGKVQGAVRKYLKQRYGVKYVDKITDKGPVRRLAQKINREDLRQVYWMIELTEKLETSLKNHGSRVIAVAAHEHCAGNPTTRKRQIRQLRVARKRLAKLVAALRFDFKVEIIMLWIGKNWMPHEISSQKPRYLAL